MITLHFQISDPWLKLNAQKNHEYTKKTAEKAIAKLFPEGFTDARIDRK